MKLARRLCALGALALLAAAFAADPEPAARRELGLRPERYAVGWSGRRSVDWYRHVGDPAWGDPRTDYVDRFAVVWPVAAPHRQAPLLVVLHGRGGGWPGKGIDLQVALADDKDFSHSAPDDFYVLVLDDMRDFHVLWNRTHAQYWWGATERYAGPGREDVARLAGSVTPCERRVLDTVEWVLREYVVDRNRVYLCGNSMGGQAAYAIGLGHGETFAAVNANVPATPWFGAARLGFVDGAGENVAAPDVRRLADPPLLVEWSATDDPWSRDRDVLVRGMRAAKWPLILTWGDFGHCACVSEARRKNPLVERFDWLRVRRDAAYPVFLDADCDDALPWPFAVFEPRRAWLGGWKGDVVSARMELAPGSKACGQVNAFFRYEVVREDDSGLEMALFLAGDGDLGCAGPERATAVVALRRMQTPQLAAAEEAVWEYAGEQGRARRDTTGALVLGRLEMTRERRVLRVVAARRAPFARADEGGESFQMTVQSGGR